MLITKEIKINLIENLEKLYSVVIKNKSKSIDRDKTIFASTEYPGTKKESTFQFFTYLYEQEYYEHFIDALLSMSSIKDNFSREYLNNKLNGILHKFLNLEKIFLQTKT